MTFIDYILGGCEINFHLAIDFTASNGDPKFGTSLHYMGNNFKNQYTDAMKSVLNVLKDYDSDQQFPVYGFGGKIPGAGVSHCFALNGNIFDPEVKGPDEVMKVYQNYVKKGTLWGPTNFASIVSHVNSFCKHSEQEISQRN